MDYVISEDDLTRLEDSMNMLGMVSTLLAQVADRDQLAMTTAELCSFVSAQADTLRQVFKQVNLRHEVERDFDRRLNALDWLTVMDVCAGKFHRPPAHAEKTTRKFEALAEVQVDMAVVLDAWRAAQATASNASLKKHLTSADTAADALSALLEREEKTAHSVIQDGANLNALKAQMRHGEFSQKLKDLRIAPRSANRCMAIHSKFACAPRIVNAAGTVSKLYELLMLDDDQVNVLERTGQAGELTLDNMMTMTVVELRTAIRQITNVALNSCEQSTMTEPTALSTRATRKSRKGVSV